jgi:hypothetical protein
MHINAASSNITAKIRESATRIRRVSRSGVGDMTTAPMSEVVIVAMITPGIRERVLAGVFIFWAQRRGHSPATGSAASVSELGFE